MPKQTLELALELQNEKERLFQGIDDKEDYENTLKKEHDFVAFCIELSKNKTFSLNLPSLTEDLHKNKENELLAIAGYIAMLTKDEDIIERSHISPEAASLPKRH